MTLGVRFAAAVVVLAATAPGWRASAAEPSPSAKAEARDRFSQGLRLFEKGENTAALAEFQRAYELIPNPVVLYNIGLVYAAMERPVEAVDALDKFLAVGGPSVTSEQGQRARKTRDEQAARVAEVEIVINKPASVDVDGVEIARTPLAMPLRLSSGAHVISVQAPGYLAAHREVTLAGQVKQTLTFDLLPVESNLAHLTLAVSVPGADVIVAGKPVGKSPLAASVAVPPGDVIVEGRRAGYRSAARTIHVDEGSNGSLSLALEEDPAAPAAVKGRLRLAISEAGAEVSVDGTVRPLPAEGLTVPGGPHVVHVARVGYLPYEKTVDVTAGAETRFVVDLVPTLETQQRESERRQTRRIVAWSVAGGGLALAAGAAIYAVATRHDIANAQSALDAQLAMETTNSDPSNHCYGGPSNPDYYADGCGDRKATLQDNVSTAKLTRDLSYAGVGLGVVAAGFGTYLLFGARESRARPAQSAILVPWSDGQSAGLIATGRF
jgi:hypothetical protein